MAVTTVDSLDGPDHQGRNLNVTMVCDGTYGRRPRTRQTLAGQLLRGSPLLRLAYVGIDGAPRVIPIGYLWKDRRIIVCTTPTSDKVKALRQNPAVAATIDYDGQPTRALLVRGVASIEVLDGVPQEYLDASFKTQSARGAGDFEAGVRAMYDSMARITITPTWARLNDFETTLPKDTERIARQKGFID